MIEIKDIEFSYSKKERPALSGINATIPPGVHLLAGENGAGKTTLLHIIAGLLHAQSGECLIDGIKSDTPNASKMGQVFLIEENMAFPYKSIRQFAKQHSRFYPNFSQEKFISNLLAFGLNGDEAMKSLSLGNRKKSQLAYALALGTKVLLLDEPTNALDIESKEVLRKLLVSSIDDDQTVIISTHTVSELENLYNGAIMLYRSSLVFAGSEEYVSERLSFEVTRVPDSEALYSEIQLGRVLSIYKADTDSDSSRIDWRLLYSALHSPQRTLILNELIRRL